MRPFSHLVCSQQVADVCQGHLVYIFGECFSDNSIGELESLDY